MEKIYGNNGFTIIPNKKIEIPEISDQRLNALYSSLKPIVTIQEKKYVLEKLSLYELRYLKFTWYPKGEGSQLVYVDSNCLETVDDFICFAPWSVYHNICEQSKPCWFNISVAQVLSQVPENILGKANAFEIIEYPEEIEDFVKYDNVAYKGYQLSKVRAYKTHK